MKRLLTGSALVLAVSFAPACDKKEEDKDKSAEADKDKKKEGGEADSKDGGDKGGGLAGAVKDAAGAAGAGGDLVKYIPESANMLVVLDAKAVFGSSVFKDNKAMIEKGEGAEMFAAANDCKVGPETWTKAVIGGDTSGDDKIVVGGQATGLGTKATIECIAKKVNEKQGADKWKVSEADGRVVVDIDGGDATGFSGGDDVFIIAGKDYAEAVKANLGGGGKSVLDGPLKDAIAGADSSKHVYFAGLATSDMAQGPTDGLKHFSGYVDFSAGLAIAASLDFGDEAKAKTTADVFSKQFEGLKGMAGGMGVPQPIVDSVKIEAKGSAVSASMSASADDLKKLSDLAAKQMGA
jgi:hypothetical protein